MVKCMKCRHLNMIVKKDKLVCSWCGYEQKQITEKSEEVKFRDIKEYLENG